AWKGNTAVPFFDGLALGGPLYRIVKECPPTRDDFCSSETLAIPFSRRRFFLATGVSLLTTRRAAVRLARRHVLGKAIAVVDLRVEGVIWTKSGGPRVPDRLGAAGAPPRTRASM